MSLAVLRSRALTGIAAPPVRVETHLANGLPVFTIVGLADTGVRESRERVRAAILNSGYEFPNRRITVNLAPADLPKESGRFDLAIALGILAASGQIPSDALDHHEFAAELSLSGELRPVRGALAMAMGLARENATRQAAGEAPRAFLVAGDNGAEAALIEDLAVHAAATLREACDHLGPLPDSRLPRAVPAALPRAVASGPDMRDVRGQAQARRAMEVAAAGQHSALLVWQNPPYEIQSLLLHSLQFDSTIARPLQAASGGLLPELLH